MHIYIYIYIYIYICIYSRGDHDEAQGLPREPLREAEPPQAHAGA